MSYFSYKLLRKLLNNFYPLFQGLKDNLVKANMRIGVRAYVSLNFFLSIISIAASSTLLFVLKNFFPFLLPEIFLNSTFSMILNILLPVLCGILVFIIFYSFPSYKVGGRKNAIEQFLPFASSYLSVASCGNMPPESICRSVLNRKEKILLSNEFGLIVEKIDLLGSDLISALENVIKNSPSSSHQNLLRGFATTIRKGGDLKKFFMTMTMLLMEKRKIRIQQFLSTIGLLAETYVIMFTVFPLLLIILLAMMSWIGGSMGGFGIIQLMYLMTFGLIPMLAIMYLLILDSIQPKD